MPVNGNARYVFHFVLRFLVVLGNGVSLIAPRGDLLGANRDGGKTRRGENEPREFFSF